MTKNIKKTMNEIITLTDGYKLDHRRQYPNNTEYVYSNWTPRSNKFFPEATDGVVVFGIQYLIQKYLIEEFHFMCYPNYFLYGKKTRDVETGEIIKYEICESGKQQNKPIKIQNILVFDDLCDGGGTFLLALDKLKKKFPKAKFHLFVYHAVQEVGLQKVCAKFDTVITTNSYADWDKLNIPNLTVLDVWD